MKTDIEIVDMFWQRDNNAINELSKKHGKSLLNLSLRILQSYEDSEETLNDSYLKTWNSIPQDRPQKLFAYVGKILRNLSIDKLRKNTSQKQGGSEVTLILHELEECISSKDNTENEITAKELSSLISKFLYSAGYTDRIFFVERYWHALKIKDIAKSII